MADDHLASLKVDQVAAWYRRLADRFATEKVDNQTPLSAVFLRQWLDNPDPTFTLVLTPPEYLKASSYVTDVLKFHRKVFLTQEKGKFHPKPERWVGVLPRLQGLPGFTLWKPTQPLDMNYESNVEIGAGYADIVRIQYKGTAAERDLFASLRGFSLRSQVGIRGANQPNGKVGITFVTWKARGTDRYDWKYDEHLTVPNPDHKSTAPDAVRPQDDTLRVYHTNAERLEKAGLAAPFNITIDEWAVTDPAITGPGEVDPSRKP